MDGSVFIQQVLLAGIIATAVLDLWQLVVNRSLACRPRTGRQAARERRRAGDGLALGPPCVLRSGTSSGQFR